MTDHTPNAQSAQEIWKEIPGFDGRYEVSDHGRVRTWYYRKGLRRQSKPKYLSIWQSKPGYLCCKLYTPEKSTTCGVHQLVMLAFVGPVPAGHEVNHKDSDKTNNSPSNLEYVTHSENLRHAVQVNGGGWGPKPSAPTPRDRAMRRMAKLGLSQGAIAVRFGVSQPYVHYIVSGKVRPPQ